MDKIINQTRIKGDLIIDGKLIFEPGLGKVEIEGKIEASLGIEIKKGTDISSGGDIFSGGYIFSGGDISSKGDIYFSYHITFKTHITCKLLRISSIEKIERKFWIEKFLLFGFRKLAQLIQEGCSSDIRQKLLNEPNIEKELLKCKYWTETERMVILSWIKGELKNYQKEKNIEPICIVDRI